MQYTCKSFIKSLSSRTNTIIQWITVCEPNGDKQEYHLPRAIG